MAITRWRAVLTLVGVVLFIMAEGYAYRRYYLLGTQFHFWLHTLFGAAVGMVLATMLRLMRPDMRVSGLVIGALVHLWSAFPDVLFIATGVVHQRWMDIFAGHISVHFIPRPVLTSAVLLLFAGAAATFAYAGRRHWAAGMLLVTAVVTSWAFAVRTPIPTSLEEVRDDPQIVLICPLLSNPDPQPPM